MRFWPIFELAFFLFFAISLTDAKCKSKSCLSKLSKDKNKNEALTSKNQDSKFKL